MSEDIPEAPRLSFEIALDASPEKVWRALTVPAYVERWLAIADADKGPAPAGTAEASRPHVATEVLESEPPRWLRWSWREAGEPVGVVTFTLTPNADGGTSLSLVHERRITALLMPTPANGNATMALAA